MGKQNTTCEKVIYENLQTSIVRRVFTYFSNSKFIDNPLQTLIRIFSIKKDSTHFLFLLS